MFSGSILFLEDFDEYYYAIDRNFLCLRQAGVLQNLSGIAIGQFTKLSDNPRPFGVSIAEMVLYHCRNYEYPIVSGNVGSP